MSGEKLTTKFDEEPFKRLNRQVVNYSGSSTSVEKEPVLPTEENFVLPLPDSESNIK